MNGMGRVGLGLIGENGDEEGEADAEKNKKEIAIFFSCTCYSMK